MTIYISETIQKTAEGIFTNSSYEAITLIQKPDEDIIKKEKIEAHITDEHRCKILNKILVKQIQQNIKMIIHLRVPFMVQWIQIQLVSMKM